MIPKNINSQRDFSGGEFNADAIRRDDTDAFKSGARQMRNWRVLNSGAATNRPGRTALFPAEGRVDEVLIAPGVTYYLCFGDGVIRIRDTTGAIVASLAAFSWTTSTLWKIVWTIVPRGGFIRDIVICYPNQRPWIARWTSPTTWAFTPFNYSLNGSGAEQSVFYRLAAPGIGIQPSDYTGAITLHSYPVGIFQAGMVGTTIRWLNRQIRILSVSFDTVATGLVIEELPGTYLVSTGAFTGSFSPGDIISGSNSGHKAEIVYVYNTLDGFEVNLLETQAPLVGTEIVVGPNGSATITSQALTIPGGSLTWDEGLTSDFRGWPASCFYDQGRLGFCDFPAVPGGIAWSAIGNYGNFYVGANADDPIFEIAPSRAHVYHVINKSDEIVFTDRGVYFIPISETNPLKPGSVAFKQIRVDASSQVKPTEISEGVIFLSSGLNRVIAVVQTGSLTQPWDIRESSLLHSHLFSSPIALSATSSDVGFPERYVYVLNADGTMVVGKYNVEKTWAGWLPWDGSGVINWAASLNGVLTLTTTYTAGASVTIAEQLSVSQYIDAGLLINAAPTAMQAGVDANFYKLELGGTTLGNMTVDDATYNIAAFDGTINKNALFCVHGVTPGGATTYGPAIGLAWPDTKTVTRVDIYAPSNDSFIASAASPGHFKLQGSNGVSWVDLTADIALNTNVGGAMSIVGGAINTSTGYREHQVIFASNAAEPVRVSQVNFFTTVSGTVHKAPNLGTGVLWYFASGTADLMDGVNPLGTHTIDASGNIVLLTPGEDTSSSTIYAGKAWTATLEPFVPHVQPGQDQQQRMKKRRIARAVISVQNSTGFVFAGKRIPPWNQDDNAAIAPPLRENSYSFRPVGRSHDPRKTLTKDMPGPLIVTEIGLEVTV